MYISLNVTISYMKRPERFGQVFSPIGTFVIFVHHNGASEQNSAPLRAAFHVLEVRGSHTFGFDTISSSTMATADESMPLCFMPAPARQRPW